MCTQSFSVETDSLLSNKAGEIKVEILTNVATTTDDVPTFPAVRLTIAAKPPPEPLPNDSIFNSTPDAPPSPSPGQDTTPDLPFDADSYSTKHWLACASKTTIPLHTGVDVATALTTNPCLMEYSALFEDFCDAPGSTVDNTVPITRRDTFLLADDDAPSLTTSQLILMVIESWSANPSDPFEDIMHNMVIENDTVVCQRHTAMVDIQGAWKGRRQDTVDSLVDGGSNIVLTDDASILEEVHSIPTIHIGLAAEGEITPRTQQGWLPQILSDGSVLRTKAYINSAATDTILSPEAILHSHPDLYRWEQQGSKGNNPGWLRFYFKADKLMLSLQLKKRNNLYYYKYV